MPDQRTYSSGLIRDIELLEVLARPDAAAGLGVSRIAELAGRDKGQVSRALATLAEAGLVARDEDTKAYRPGWRLFALATHATETQLAHLSAPFLRKVVAGLNETTHLCVLRGNRVLTLHSELATHAFRGVGWEGTSVDPYTTSAGRTLMSEWDDETISRWWELFPPDRLTLPTATAIPVGAQADPQPLTLNALLDRIAGIRKYGYGQVDEEFEPGLVGVSAPVYGFRGDIVAAINVSAPKQRLGRHLRAAGEFTRSVADQLSATLGAPRR
ncbi:IclR family transcriptional regulator [Nocardia sp. NBC_00508]|uniref:IclR family transcriptional regulator n=1 Tax=Nocardia sp. NBC_00508 TaxID=2975992 RepID=UPI002E813840|nr:IclR family transcriptional regulator [Nocardia sp. NBC_00508]WUD64679.1 IclR family transcriptional regulator [Nocardia sp. NBC_00508]